MRITNFRLKERAGSNPLDWMFKALVSVETGFIFKKKEDVVIHRSYGFHWVFAETGKYTPGCDVERLVKIYEAEIMESIETCVI